MNEDPDYTAVVEDPPDPAETGAGVTAASSPLLRNLQLAKDEHPGEWVRIATYASRNVADVTASELRSGKRLKSRPEGGWDFKSGPTTDERFGVWAKYLGVELVLHIDGSPMDR